MWYALERLQEGIFSEDASTISHFFASELIKCGASPNTICDTNSNTLLHVFSARGCEAAATFLIEKTATATATKKENLISINAVNEYGETPLHASARGGLCNVATALLRRGANPNIQVK